eukprot:gnl/MRDRNA2_/MRDRNA2_28274_c0_seq1.p1 gnl/MRDRNA2_/MRDRNA2_28274_c0~~gnl/MRDRNA2_/MRDRNA2_28274_c0_seq1.p1  ORF type:complete len:175 (-),score=7.67 gnl/MRDRNA2_/MRDRNA2_28274_c0_seq1:137-661(-)
MSIMEWIQQQFSFAYEALFEIKPQHYHRRSQLIGISCWFLLAPGIYSAYNGDMWQAGFSLLVVFSSFMGDFMMLGTYWDVIDRWVGIVYAMQLTKVCFPHAPILVTLNLPFVGGWLSYSRNSTSFEDWRIRHTAWHLVMAVDVCFFLSMVYEAKAMEMIKKQIPSLPDYVRSDF